MSLIESLLYRRQSRATLNMPSVPLSEAYDLLVSGDKSKSGVEITDTKALGLPGFWKGVNLVCRAVGKTPLTVKKRKGEIKELDRLHPAWYLLRKVPTGAYSDVPMTPFLFKQTIMGHVLVFGNGFAYIVRDTDSTPVALILLDPRSVTPIRENGKLVYIVGITTGDYRRINPMNMLHIRGLSYDGITGYSVIDILKDTLGLNLAYQINQSVFFRNGMRPGWVIEVPWRFKDENAVKDFRKRLGNVHQGIERSHIPAVLENGAKASALNISQEDAQFLQSREFDLRMVANILFLPSSKLNDVAKVAYNSLEQENQSVLDEAYEPWFVLWEEELEFKLLTEDQKINDSHEIVFERRRLVQTPFKDRVEGYNKGVLGGWLGRDEVRGWEDLNPIPDGDGQKFFQPVNVVVVGEESKEPEKPEEQVEEKKTDDEEGEDNIEDERIEKARQITLTELQDTANRLFQRRIVLTSKRKITDSSKFMNWVLDEVFECNRMAFYEMLDSKVRLLRLLDNRSTDTNTMSLVDDYLLTLRGELNSLAGLVRSECLAIEVDKFMVKHEAEIGKFVDILIERG